MFEKILSLGRFSTQISLGVLAGVGILPMLLHQPSLAQSATDVRPLADFTQDDRNPFSNNGSGQSSAVMDLIHRANFGSPRPTDEFLQEQRVGIDSAAAEFRKMQLQRIQSQQQPSATSVPTQTTQP